jgi:hypothetical protein
MDMKVPTPWDISYDHSDMDEMMGKVSYIAGCTASTALVLVERAVRPL